MDYTAEELEDLAKMRELRLRLRACADAKVAECEAMHPGKTWLEIYRQMRALEAADRMVVRLYAPPLKRRAKRAETSVNASPARPRKTLGDLASEALVSEVAQTAAARAVPQEAATIFTSPPPLQSGNSRSEEGGEQVEPQAERVETEGAAFEQAPATPEATPADLDPEAEAMAEATLAIVEKSANVIADQVRKCAEWAHLWPDGTFFDAYETDWRHHVLIGDLNPPIDNVDDDYFPWLNAEVLGRVNLMTRLSARFTEVWPDLTPYSETDPDYFTISSHFGSNIAHRAPDEQRGPPKLPWWIVHRSSP